MFVSKFRIGLKVLKNIKIKKQVNYFLYSGLFSLLKKGCSDFADSLKKSVVKPFSLSLFKGGYEYERDFIVFNGSRYYFEVSCIGKEVSKLFYAMLSEAVIEKKRINLGGAEFVFSSIEPAGSKKRNTKYGFKEISRGKVAERIMFRFVSPTAFRRGKRNLLFPEAYNVFNSVYRKWRAFGGREMKGITKLDLNNYIYVNRYKLNTVTFDVKNTIVTGFIGECGYIFSNEADKSFIKNLTLLADFSNYTGVGIKTALGMGNVEVSYE